MNRGVALFTTCMACGPFICIALKTQRHRKEALCLVDADRTSFLEFVQYIDK